MSRQLKIFIFIFLLPLPWFLASYASSVISKPERRCSEFSFECAKFYYEHYWSVKKGIVKIVGSLKNSTSISRKFGDVYVGKGSWLFYVGKRDGDPVADFVGEELPQAVKKNWIEFFDSRLREESSFGINAKYFLILVPNKSRVYRENIETMEYRDSFSDPFRSVFQKVDQLPHRSSMLSPNELVDFYRGFPEELYDRLDTHWNLLGALKAYNLLAKKNNLPPMLENIVVRRPIVPGGDLYTILREKGGRLKQPNTEFSSYKFRNLAFPKTKGRILVVGDSFRVAFARVIEKHFDYVEDVHISALADTIENIRAKRFDFVVEVRSERRLRSRYSWRAELPLSYSETEN